MSCRVIKSDLLRFPSLLLSAVVFAVLFSSTAFAHKGPDPVARWVFDSVAVQGNKLSARLGPDGKLSGRVRLVKDEHGESLHFTGWGSDCVIAKEHSEVSKVLPTKAITVSAWVSIDEQRSEGGLIGTLQDNWDERVGWRLGYSGGVFTFALGSEGGKRGGRGQLTHLKGKTAYEHGRWYHVVAIYDGQKMELYVNGELDATSDFQSGAILYPSSAPLTIGVYRNSSNDVFHHGRIRSIAIYDLAAKGSWVKEEFKHGNFLVNLAASQTKTSKMGFLVKPYLQYGTKDGMTVMWRTTQPGSTTVHYGETFHCEKSQVVAGTREIHEVRLEGLETGKQYFYRVDTENELGEGAVSEGSTFTTAVDEKRPYAFAVFGDTQGNPEVSAKLAKLAWAQRPSFVVHAGDLVSTGSNPDHWTQHFFPGMEELISRVPLYPVLGNHEDDSHFYYDYMSLPAPEYYYTFRFGNCQFFMVDSNRNMHPGSEQYVWLEKSLKESKARWKFVCHHHPPYSSEEDDYGDLWKTNKSERGDLDARQMSPLYEKYEVDMVWNGHIHSYERTWPIFQNAAKERGAPIYMITGGGGGGLEQAGPYRPYFQNHVRHGHHYVMVHINGGTLELRSYSLDDKLFDHVTIIKGKK